MEQFVTQFGINWKILLAQAVNFFILFILLAKFAYRPIIQMLKERRERIEKGLQLTTEAEHKMAEINQLRLATLSEAKDQSLQIIHEGEERGKTREQEIIAKAQSNAETLITQAHTQIDQERIAMQKDVYAEATGLLKDAMIKVLQKSDISETETALIQSTLKEAQKKLS